MSKLMNKNSFVPIIAQSINAILTKFNLKLTWHSKLIDLENELDFEKQKNQHQFNHLEELKKLVDSGQIVNNRDFFANTLVRLENYSVNNSLTKDEVKTIYKGILKDAFLILSSPIFETFPLEFQVEVIGKIFFAILNVQHRNANIIGDILAEHYERILGHNDLQEVMAFKIYEYLYGLYWCGASSLSDMKKFDLVGVRPFAKYVNDKFSPSIPTSETVLSTKQTLNICYFCHYAHFQKGNAISPIIMSLAKAHALIPNRHIFVYCVQWASDEFTQAFTETNVIVRFLDQQSHYGSVDHIITQMKADQIDVAITDISSSIATYTFLHRPAPIQMWLELGYPYWSISQLDWAFLCAKDYQDGFGIPANRYSSLIPKQDEITLLQDCSQSALDEARKLLPKDGKILAVFTRLIKITPAYLDIVRQILLNNPKSHFLIVGTGDPQLIYNFITDQKIEGRVTFLHHNVDLNVYGRIIDIFLDTFPFIGGNACREVAIHGKPILSLYHLDFGRLLIDERDPDLLAKNADEYIAIAQRLATDPEFYQAKSEMAVNLAKKTTNVEEAVDEIDRVIQKLVQEK